MNDTVDTIAANINNNMNINAKTRKKRIIIPLRRIIRNARETFSHKLLSACASSTLVCRTFQLLYKSEHVAVLLAVC